MSNDGTSFITTDILPGDPALLYPVITSSAKVYKILNGAINQIGQEINSVENNAQLNQYKSFYGSQINSDGTKICIWSGYQSVETATFSFYSFNNNEWVNDSEININNFLPQGTNSGFLVSDNWSTFAVKSANGISVYHPNVNGNGWILNTQLQSGSYNYQFDSNYEGTMIAVNQNNGFKTFNLENDSWIETNNVITTDSEFLGVSVSLSSDGTRIAVMEAQNNAYTGDVNVSIYDYSQDQNGNYGWLLYSDSPIFVPQLTINDGLQIPVMAISNDGNFITIATTEEAAGSFSTTYKLENNSYGLIASGLLQDVIHNVNYNLKKIIHSSGTLMCLEKEYSVFPSGGGGSTANTRITPAFKFINN